MLALIYGEIVACDTDGRSSFNVLCSVCCKFVD
jgi:hypothetical protein